MSDNSALRNIPQVEKLLQDGRLAPYAEVLGRSVLADVVRSETERFRESLRAGSAGDADTLIDLHQMPMRLAPPGKDSSG